MTPPTEGRTSNDRTRGRLAVVVALLLAVTSLAVLLGPNAAAVSIGVPYGTAVADADLDGSPSTGAWTDAISATIPLENGASAPYGTATLHAKHDGTNAYFRIDGSIDVPWTSANGNRFWLGLQISPSGTSHHGGATWDGVFFGLWDGTDYSPQPTYPPPAVDTNGFSKPPAKDASQDAVGKMGVTGSAAPYAFTAEWKRPLASGDASDLALADDGATTYRFFVTTDSNGGGSSGGSIGHNGVTNANTLSFAKPSAGNTPPQVSLSSPNGGQAWTGGSAHAIAWTMSDAETATSGLRVWINASLDGTTYGPVAGAQGISGLASPASFAWTLPLANTAAARVRVTIVDANGGSASATSSAPFTIDSSPPAVASTTPANGSTGILASTQAVVRFSEPMNRTSATAAFSLVRLDTNTRVTGTSLWTGNDLTFTPSAPLAAGVTYEMRVGGTAKDASDPGNALGTAFAADFTTVVLPPLFTSVSVTPSVQEAGSPVNITVQISGAVTLSSLNVTVRDSGGNLVSQGNLIGGPTMYTIDVTLRVLGQMDFVLTARETSGAVTTFSGTFAVVDTTPPVAAAGPDQQVWHGTVVTFDGSASHDNSALVNFTWSFAYNGTNVSLARVTATFLFDQVGRYDITLQVTDEAGLNGTDGMVVTVTADTMPPPAPTNLAIFAVASACLKVTWSASNASDLAGYQLYRWNQTRAAFEKVADTPPDTTSFTDCGLGDDTVYSYWVVAVDQSGNPSAPSPIDNGRTLAAATFPAADSLLVYQSLAGILLIGSLILAVLWAEDRRRRRPPAPGPPRKRK